ncbi:MAG TPA: dihydroorotase [Candidatus Omnitrophota bacterium]|nr:dihydroorotase [Candidatus Omnitrophota bacterium]HPN87795.1 dihydroorotase [Candidatus Omnitrophota bacterium]
MSLLIKNAKIVNADKEAQNLQDILIEKGVIIKIAPSINTTDVPILDIKGKRALPGLIDLHVHLREPGREDKETIESGSRAAVKGGFTTVFCMPNTNPVIDNCMIVESIIKEAKRVGLVNVVPIGAITRGLKGEELVDMFEMKQAGCFALSDDGKCVSNARVMKLALQYAQMAQILLIQHAEDHALAAEGVMHEGYYSTLLGLKPQPGLAETVMIARDIELAHYLKTRIHFAHVSLKRSVELIKIAKSQGIQVTAEACPHHFSLTDEAVKSFDTNLKVNPPLRSREDVEAIKQALKDGILDCISTDHAPHTPEDKEAGFDLAPFGMIGLETAVGLVCSELVQQKILSWPQVAQKMSQRSAEIMGLKTKGEIKEGMDGDLTVIDAEKEWEFKKEMIASKSKNSPFIGRKFKGCVEATICGGKIVYENQVV